MNILKSTIQDEGGFAVATVAGAKIATRVPMSVLPASDHWRLGLRPECIKVSGDGHAATVEFVERLGERTLVYAKLSDGTPITAEDAGNSRVTMGDAIHLKIDSARAHLFSGDGSGYHADEAA